MRIRKHASKVLGSVAVFPSYSPPAAAQIWSQSLPWLLQGSATAGPLCELNRSPWDVMPSPPSPSPNQFPTDSHQAVAKRDEDESIMGNNIKLEVEAISPIATSTATLSFVKKKVDEEVEKVKSMEKREEKKDEKRRTRIQRSKETASRQVAATAVATSCKKTEGKKWKCKRPSHGPHTLCHYRLSQVRSYKCNQNYKVPAAETHPRNQRKRMVEEACATTEPGSNYYYYSGFGPWRGKRRNGNGGEGGDGEVTQDVVGNESKETSVFDIHIDTRESEDDAADDRGGRSDADGADDNAEEEQSDGSEHRTHQPHNRKQRRKRVKARSLKSLL